MWSWMNGLVTSVSEDIHHDHQPKEAKMPDDQEQNTEKVQFKLTQQQAATLANMSCPKGTIVICRIVGDRLVCNCEPVETEFV